MASHEQADPSTSQQPAPILGRDNQFAPIGAAISGPTVQGSISSGRDTIVGTNVYITYTGQSQPLDEEARLSLEQAYRSELAWRYAVWRSRFAPLTIQAQLRRQPVQPGRLFEREELRFQAFQSTAQPSKTAGEHATSEIQSYTFADLCEELQRHNHILLLGPPGGGKTTALWRLALDLAEDGLYRDQQAPLPVFVRLGGLSPDQALDDLLRTELEQAVVYDAERNEFPLSAHRLLAPLLDQLLAEGRLLLLWDGLNETPQESFGTTAQAIDAFRRTHPGQPAGFRNLSIVTCRSDDYALLTAQLAANPLPQHQQATIQGLDHATVERVIIGQLGAERGQELLHALAAPEQRALAELARTPLLLYMLCTIYGRDQRLPANRGQLLETFIAMRWAWEAEVQKDRWIDADIQRRALAALGYAITESQGRGTSVPWKWARTQLAPQLGAIAPEQLRNLAQRADLIELLDGGRALRFSHQLIQEYFAAVALQQKLAAAVRLRKSWYFGERRAEQVLRRYAAPGERTGWEETLLLLAGIEGEHGQARALIRTFLSQPLQAARLLLAGGEAGPALVEEVRLALPTVLADAKRYSVRERVEAGRILGQLGDPRIPVTRDAWRVASTTFSTREATARLSVTAQAPLLNYWCEVTAGTFLLGSMDADKQAYDDEKPQRSVNLPAFRIARFPITNAQWKQFIDAGGYKERRWWSEAGWQAKEREGWTVPRYWDNERFNGANQPVVGVSWYEASAYCRWLTAQGHSEGWLPRELQIRLPSEAEWEKAARGDDGRIYPWGDEWDTAKANTREDDVGATTPVGCYPDGASPFGALDMSGNVWEWTATPWTNNYSEDDGTEVELSNGNRFVWRGDSWADDLQFARCAYRYYDIRPTNGDLALGVWLVAALERVTSDE